MNYNIFDEISVLVVGYDGYIDVWDYCFELMNKYWNKRPRTYLATSELEPSYDNVIVVAAGQNSEWSRRAMAALDNIITPYVLLLLEDFYVDNNVIEEVLKSVKDNDIKYYQILVQLVKQNWERGKAFKGNKHIHVIPKDKKYGLNLQAAIWKTDFLKEKIGSGNYNAWIFEMNQLEEKNYNVKKIEFLIDDRNILNITHMIVQSKYLRGAIKKMKKKGYDIDLTKRSQLSKMDDFKYNLKLLMYSLTPKFLVKQAKAIGKRMNIDFVTDRIDKKIN